MSDQNLQAVDESSAAVNPDAQAQEGPPEPMPNNQDPFIQDPADQDQAVPEINGAEQPMINALVPMDGFRAVPNPASPFQPPVRANPPVQLMVPAEQQVETVRPHVYAPMLNIALFNSGINDERVDAEVEAAGRQNIACRDESSSELGDLPSVVSSLSSSAENSLEEHESSAYFHPVGNNGIGGRPEGRAPRPVAPIALRPEDIPGPSQPMTFPRPVLLTPSIIEVSDDDEVAETSAQPPAPKRRRSNDHPE